MAFRRTRTSLAAQIALALAGKQSAKEHLRACISAVAEVDAADADSVQSTAAYLKAGRCFTNLMQSLFRQAGIAEGGGCGSGSEESLFVRCLQQWTPPNSPEGSATTEKPIVVKGKGKRPFTELSTLSLSDIKESKDLKLAFPDWDFEISVPRKPDDLAWLKKGPQGTLPMDTTSMSDEAVAAVAEVVFLALFFSETFNRYGGGIGNLPVDEYKYYVQVCTVLTAIAAFSDQTRLTVNAWSPESAVTAAEQQAVDGLAALLEEASLAVSHEQNIRGNLTKGRTEAAVIEENDEWARHRGSAEIKKSLVNEFNGVIQNIAEMAAQTEHNWQMDDEAEQRPSRPRRSSDQGEPVGVQSENADAAGPSGRVERCASASSAGLAEDFIVPRQETKFGVSTDYNKWLILHMLAQRGTDGRVRAKVTSSGCLTWRGDGTFGQKALFRALTAVMLPGLAADNTAEWCRRAALVKEAMAQHAQDALDMSNLGHTEAAKALRERNEKDMEIARLRAEVAALKANSAESVAVGRNSS